MPSSIRPLALVFNTFQVAMVTGALPVASTQTVAWVESLEESDEEVRR